MERYDDYYSRADRRDVYSMWPAPSAVPQAPSQSWEAPLGSTLHRPQWDSSQLSKFEKNFYKEHPDVKKITSYEAEDYRKRKQILVHGREVPKPIRTFEEASFPGIILILIII